MIVLVTTLGAMDGIPLGTYDVSVLVSSECYGDLNTDRKFEVLLQGD